MSFAAHSGLQCDSDGTMMEIIRVGGFRCIPGLRPLDLLLFRSEGSLSLLMQRISRPAGLKDEIYWSHAGVAVDSTVLPGIGLEDGVLYVMESTVSSETLLGDEPDAVHGRGRSGLQIRRLDRVLIHFSENKHNGFDAAYCNLKNQPKQPASVVPIVQRFYAENRGAHFQSNCVHLFAAVSPRWRWLRDSLCCRSVGEKDMYCSQLVAALYIRLGLLDAIFDSRDVLPHDFLGNDPDGIPVIVNAPVRLV